MSAGDEPEVIRTEYAESALVITADCAKTLGAGASTSSICQSLARATASLLTNNPTLSLSYAASSISLVRTSSTPYNSRTPFGRVAPRRPS